ncbi:GNAT family N-acetyltransferase [Flavobacterium sediminilitoris]|uniref:GNAT family N-acetyltransferase n=1 Tax=Flavobacterium sediminilitoris TaxID=2024526 RepID=A0ABY4HM81_9FLAO|nr:MULTISPECIES: GNAT family N-acetyltransferase [Flavobacterium]UOX33972.1 GNAT family N-acetyltransferase [Flavobacterium sediminilitoris]
MNLQPVLSNELITIRPLKESDFNALFSIASDKLIWEQHPNNDRYKKDVFKVFFEKALASNSAFAVIDTATERIIGSSRYYDLDSKYNNISIGFTFISRDYWGTNYNSNLKKLMIDYAFQFVNSIYFHVGATNFRSQKAVLKLGAIKVEEPNNETNWLYELKKIK